MTSQRRVCRTESFISFSGMGSLKFTLSRQGSPFIPPKEEARGGMAASPERSRSGAGSPEDETPYKRLDGLSLHFEIA